MQNIRIVTCFLGSCFTLLTLLGCGSATENPIVPVEGKIALASGKRLPAGTRVVFNPAEGRVRAAIGTTADDGTFKVQHVNGSAGAEEGKYTLKLMPPESGSTDFDKVVPKQFQEQPFAFAEVKAGMSALDFKVPDTKR